jgi:hypothetical protein
MAMPAAIRRLGNRGDENLSAYQLAGKAERQPRARDHCLSARSLAGVQRR